MKEHIFVKLVYMPLCFIINVSANSQILVSFLLSLVNEFMQSSNNFGK